MADRHYLTGGQSRAIDTVLNWWDRIGRRLELPKPKSPRELPILPKRITQQVVTDFRVDGLTLQIKTRDILITPGSTESDWTTVHTGTSCSTST